MRAARIVALLAAASALVAVAPLVASTSYPGAAWSAAASCNFTASNRESTYNIDTIVIHTAEGSYSGTISWFKNCAAGASAHYVVSKGGDVTAMVRDEDIAWHAGWWYTNTHSIGIEHEGFTYTCCYTDAEYRASAALTRWVADRYNVPLDRSHIIGHYQVPGCASGSGGGTGCHTDPGPYWDWTYYMQLVVNGGADTTPPGAPALSENALGSAWTNRNVAHFAWSASDPQSGIARYEVAPSWSGAFQTTATEWRPTVPDGAHTLRVRAQNGAGLWSAWSGAVTVRVDTTPPATRFAPDASWRAGATTYLGPSSRVALASTDALSGVAWTRYAVDGGAAQAYAGPVARDGLAEGAHSLAAWSGDVAGNVEAQQTFAFTLDRTPPDLTSIAPGEGSVLAGTDATGVSAAAADALSGVARVTFSVDATPRAASSAAPFGFAWPAYDEALGPHYLTVTATDHVGNAASKRVDVDTVPSSGAGVAATEARALGWAASPPTTALVATADSTTLAFAAGVMVGDQWVGAKGAPAEALP